MEMKNYYWNLNVFSIWIIIITNVLLFFSFTLLYIFHWFSCLMEIKGILVDTINVRRRPKWIIKYFSPWIILWMLIAQWFLCWHTIRPKKDEKEKERREREKKNSNKNYHHRKNSFYCLISIIIFSNMQKHKNVL